MLIWDRPLVNSSMFAPGMPTSVLVVSPSPCVRGDVVVVAHAAANVHDHRVAEHTRPVCRGAHARVGATAGEPSVCGPAVFAEEARVEDHRALEAQATDS